MFTIGTVANNLNVTREKTRWMWFAYCTVFKSSGIVWGLWCQTSGFYPTVTLTGLNFFMCNMGIYNSTCFPGQSECVVHNKHAPTKY